MARYCYLPLNTSTCLWSAGSLAPLRRSHEFLARERKVCDAAGLEIEHASKSHIRKEKLVQRVLASRGCMTWITSHPRNKPLRRLPSERGMGGNAKERWRLMRLAKSGFAGVQVLLTPGHALTIFTK